MSRFVIYGSRDFGRVLKSMLVDLREEVAGYVDDWDSGEDILGSSDVILPKLDRAQHCFVVAIGYKHLKSRWAIYERVRKLGFQTPALIHPRAYVHESACIEEGAIVMAGAIVDLNARIGPLSVLWPGAIINHDSSVGANTFVSPSATVCGCSNIGRDCMIGAGAVIVDHTTVIDDSFIKAGEVFQAGSKTKKLRNGGVHQE